MSNQGERGGMATTLRQTNGQASSSIEKSDVGLLYRGPVDVDFEAGFQALKRSAARLTELIRGIDSPSANPPRLTWTNAEVAVHLIETFKYDLDNVRGASEQYPVIDGKLLSSGSQASAQRIAEQQERDPKKLAVMFSDAVANFLDEIKDRDPDQPVAFAQGHAMTLANLIGTLLGEVLVHGHDIAKGDGKKWTMDPEGARQAVYATTATLPIGVNPETTRDVDLRLNVRVRGGRCFQIHLHNGTGETLACGKADATISTDAGAMLLAGFGRVNPLGLTLRGKIFAWGRNPVLPARLGKYLLPI
jgi:uncharacterized protein (TIGR03083 family)